MGVLAVLQALQCILSFGLLVILFFVLKALKTLSVGSQGKKEEPSYVAVAPEKNTHITMDTEHIVLRKTPAELRKEEYYKIKNGIDDGLTD